MVEAASFLFTSFGVFFPKFVRNVTVSTDIQMNYFIIRQQFIITIFFLITPNTKHHFFVGVSLTADC